MTFRDATQVIDVRSTSVATRHDTPRNRLLNAHSVTGSLDESERESAVSFLFLKHLVDPSSYI